MELSVLKHRMSDHKEHMIHCISCLCIWGLCYSILMSLYKLGFLLLTKYCIFLSIVSIKVYFKNFKMLKMEAFIYIIQTLETRREYSVAELIFLSLNNSLVTKIFIHFLLRKKLILKALSNLTQTLRII